MPFNGKLQVVAGLEFVETVKCGKVDLENLEGISQTMLIGAIWLPTRALINRVAGQNQLASGTPFSFKILSLRNSATLERTHEATLHGGTSRKECLQGIPVGDSSQPSARTQVSCKRMWEGPAVRLMSVCGQGRVRVIMLTRKM